MRLFIAVTLPPAWKNQMHTAVSYLSAHALACTPTRRENFHLSLVFLGETDHLDEINTAMDRVQYPVFSLRSGLPGCSKRVAGDSWWLGVEDNASLMEMRTQLADSLRAEGVPLNETPYHPQLSLARQVTLTPDFDPEHLASLLPPMEFQVTYITLLKSELLKDGRLLYTPLHRTPLILP